MNRKWSAFNSTPQCQAGRLHSAVPCPCTVPITFCGKIGSWLLLTKAAEGDIFVDPPSVGLLHRVPRGLCKHCAWPFPMLVHFVAIADERVDAAQL